MIVPKDSISCVDCGGEARLITMPREDGMWLVGDIVSYRCRDCLDRWDIELTEEDLVEEDRDL